MGPRAIVILILVLSGGCRSADSPPPAPPIPPLPSATSVPPPPERPPNRVELQGRVTTPRGLPAEGARLRAWGADATCVPSGSQFETTSGADGTFTLLVTRGIGPTESGCILIEAALGGSQLRRRIPGVFASGEGADHRVFADFHLPPPAILGFDEAEKMVRDLAAAPRAGDPRAIEDLDLYVRGNAEAFRGALEQMARYLRDIHSVERLDKEPTMGAYRFRLHGVAGRTATIDVVQQDLIELRGPLIDDAPRAWILLRRVLQMAHEGDADRMARILTADDEEEDLPVEKAQRLVERLRTRFDLGRTTITLTENDEEARLFRYRISGESRSGEPGEEIMEIGYGDGLVWLRGLK